MIVLHQIAAEGRGLASIAVLPDEVNELGGRHLTHAVEFRRSRIVGPGVRQSLAHKAHTVIWGVKSDELRCGNYRLYGLYQTGRQASRTQVT